MEKVTGRGLRLGIGSYTYGWEVGVPGSMPVRPLTVIGLIERAVELDMSLVQVGDNHPLDLYEPFRLSGIREELELSGCSVELGARGLTAARLSEYIRLSEFFGAKILRFVTDSYDYAPAVDRMAGVIREQAEDLERARVTLALENHDRLPARVMAELIEACRTEHCGICLDTANSMGLGEGWETVIDRLLPYTVNLHIKDYTIERLPYKMGFRVEGQVAGRGMLDIPVLLGRIGSYGRCHTAILEQWVPPETGIAETICKERRWAEESLRYLRSVYDWSDRAEE